MSESSSVSEKEIDTVFPSLALSGLSDSLSGSEDDEACTGASACSQVQGWQCEPAGR